MHTRSASIGNNDITNFPIIEINEISAEALVGQVELDHKLYVLFSITAEMSSDPLGNYSGDFVGRFELLMYGRDLTEKLRPQRRESLFQFFEAPALLLRWSIGGCPYMNGQISVSVVREGNMDAGVPSVDAVVLHLAEIGVGDSIGGVSSVWQPMRTRASTKMMVRMFRV